MSTQDERLYLEDRCEIESKEERKGRGKERFVSLLTPPLGLSSWMYRLMLYIRLCQKHISFANSDRRRQTAIYAHAEKFGGKKQPREKLPPRRQILVQEKSAAIAMTVISDHTTISSALIHATEYINLRPPPTPPSFPLHFLPTPRLTH